jgi:hypothetical protein
VDLLFFDTTSTYFEVEQADEAIGRDEHGRAVGEDAAPAGEAGFRSFGKSKDHRDDLPQVIVGKPRDPRRDPGALLVLAR